MKLTMIMPSCRWWFWPLIKANYEKAFCPGVIPKLAVVLWPEEIKSIPTFALDIISSAWWIKILEVEKQEGIAPGVHKLNAALDQIIPDYDGYIQSTSDDNLIPLRFFREFANGADTGKKVIVFSHDRGQRDIYAGVGIGDLIASPDNMKPCHVNHEQYIVHASLWKHIGTGPAADGDFITELWNTHPEEFYFRPEFKTPSSAIEVGKFAGRFDNDKLKQLLET